MISSDHLKQVIVRNATEISQLKARIDETVRTRTSGPRERDAWRSACAEFHARYDELAFPGGYEGVSERILVGDPLTVEAALCFLELRPYFFRSGYMYKDILRKVKRAPLEREQSQRLADVMVRQAAWKASRA